VLGLLYRKFRSRSRLFQAIVGLLVLLTCATVAMLGTMAVYVVRIDRAIGRGHALLTQDTPESLAAALTEFQLAAQLSRRFEDRDFEATAFLGLGRVYMRLKKYGDAEESFAEARRLSHLGNNTAAEALALRELGSVAHEQQDDDEALRYFDESLALSRATDDRMGQAIVLMSIAQVHVVRGDHPDVLRLYKEALPLLPSVDDQFLQSEMLAAIIQYYTIIQRHREAVDDLQAVLPAMRASGNSAGEAQLLNAIGENYRSLDEYDQALEAYTPALAIVRNLGDRVREVEILDHIGVSYAVLGQRDRAMELYEQSATLAHELGDRVNEAIGLYNVGAARAYLGDVDAAQQWFERALAVERARDDGDEASILVEIGKDWLYTGEQQLALDSFYRALDLLASGGEAPPADVLKYIGQVYVYLGRSDEASSFFERALEPFGPPASPAMLRSHDIAGLMDEMDRAAALNNLGRAHLMLGDHQQAAEMFSRALSTGESVASTLKAIFVEQGTSEDANAYVIADYVARSLDGLGEASYGVGNFADALTFSERALSQFKKAKDLGAQARAIYNVALAHAALRRPKEALDLLRDALPLARRLFDRDGEAHILGRMALVQMELGDLNAARDSAEGATKIAAVLREKVISPDLRASYVGSNSYSEIYVDVLMRLHGEHPDEGYDREALEASEAGRGRSLLDLLTESSANIREGIDSALGDRERVLKERLNSLAELKRRALTGEGEAEQLSRLDRNFGALNAEYEQLQAEIRRTSPAYSAIQRPPPLGLAEIQQLLDADTVLLDYALGAERSYLWTVTTTSFRSYQLPGRPAIEARAGPVIRNLTEPGRTRRFADPRAEADAMSSLRDTILGPAAADLTGKRIVVISDGILNYLPFAALPLPAEGTATAQPLITKYEVVNLPSAAALDRLRRAAANRTAPAKLVSLLADPVFSSDDVRMTDANLAQQGPVPVGQLLVHGAGADVGAIRDKSFPRLTGTLDEANAIGALVSNDQKMVAVGWDANRNTALSGALSESRYVHFATHGVLDSQHPQLSGLVLSLVDRTGRPVDGFLRLHDIFNLKLNADMVVLSACQTGLGKEVRGEGLVGITRGFMYAGAPRVVVSLWKVDDASTAALMKTFYEGILQKKLTPAAALRAAQIEVSQDPRWRHPYYWADFVLQGEWN
jgi:CHAT domain-containing protein/tetratricopeptide (TPR) repeat protein